MRILLTGAALLLLAAVFGVIGFHIGQALQGSPAALFALLLGLVAIGGVWWWTSRKN